MRIEPAHGGRGAAYRADSGDHAHRDVAIAGEDERKGVVLQCSGDGARDGALKLERHSDLGREDGTRRLDGATLDFETERLEPGCKSELEQLCRTTSHSYVAKPRVEGHDENFYSHGFTWRSSARMMPLVPVPGKDGRAGGNHCRMHESRVVSCDAGFVRELGQLVRPMAG